VTGRVRRLIKINHTRTNIGLEVALERGTSIGNWSEMGSANEYCELISKFSYRFETFAPYNCCNS
jgi:hypothetical protein